MPKQKVKPLTKWKVKGNKKKGYRVQRTVFATRTTKELEYIVNGGTLFISIRSFVSKDEAEECAVMLNSKKKVARTAPVSLNRPRARRVGKKQKIKAFLPASF